MALVGIIGFVGLLAPQLTKRVIGEDKRFTLPATLLMGACIVLFSDCIARDSYIAADTSCRCSDIRIRCSFIFIHFAERGMICRCCQ